MTKRTASGLIGTYWPVALGIAGIIGGVVGFVLKDLPLLAPRVAGSGHLTWSETSSPNVCRAHFAVSFENAGTTDVSVSKVRVRAWLIDEPPSTNAKALYFDAPSFLSKEKPITDVLYRPSSTYDATAVPPPFVVSYYAGMLYNHSFEWDVTRAERRFYVYAELFRRDSDTRTDWYFNASSRVCEDPQPLGSERSPK